jgi:hypothetical protein
MRSYIKCYKDLSDRNGAPLLVFSDDIPAGQSEDDAVFVQTNLGLHQYTLLWLNLIADMSNDYQTRPPGQATFDPMHALDYTLIQPYANHPLN